MVRTQDFESCNPGSNPGDALVTEQKTVEGGRSSYGAIGLARTITNREVPGSSPGRSKFKEYSLASIAQLVERALSKRKVASSILVGGWSW